MGIELPPWWAHLPIGELGVTAALILGYATGFVLLVVRDIRLNPVVHSRRLSLVGAVGFVGLAGSVVLALLTWLGQPPSLLEVALLGVGLLSMGLAGSAAAVYWLRRGSARTAPNRRSLPTSVTLFVGSTVLAGAVYRLVVGGILRLILP